jgi:hypothetical protein
MSLPIRRTNPNDHGILTMLNGIQTQLQSALPAPRPTGSIPKQDHTSITVPAAIVDTLDLSAEGRNIFETFQDLDDAEKASYLKNLARLLKEGIVGTEELEIRGETYHSFASTRFADPAIARAKSARVRPPS